MKIDDLYVPPRYRLDDLNNGYHLMQDTQGFRFGMDAVLLAHFAADNIKKRDENVCELCCGNGAVSVMMLAVRPQLHITGVELQSEAAALAAFNAGYNGITDSFTVINNDLRDMASQFNGRFGAVVINPPYNAADSCLISADNAKSTARSDAQAPLAAIMKTAARLLRDKGCLFMVHRASRLSELVREAAAVKLEPKILRFVHSRDDKKANLMLLCAVKNGGVWLDVPPPLIVYEKPGKYTKQIYEIYGMKEDHDEDNIE